MSPGQEPELVPVLGEQGLQQQRVQVPELVLVPGPEELEQQRAQGQESARGQARVLVLE